MEDLNDDNLLESFDNLNLYFSGYAEIQERSFHKIYLQDFRKLLEDKSLVLNSCQDELNTIEDLRRQCHLTQSETMQSIKKKKEEISRSKKDVEQERLRLLEMKREYSLKNERLKELTLTANEQEKELSNKENKSKDVAEHANCGVNMYRKNLGLNITKTNHGSLAFCFTQISRSNPSKEFVIDMVIEDRQYKLLKVVPDLKNVGHFVKALNSTNDLGSFLAAIRREFLNTNIK